MRKFLSFTSVLAILFLLSCGGSNKAGSDGGVVVGDAQEQARIQDLQEKINDNPNNPVYRRQLAEIYENAGHSLEAMKTLEPALAMDPNDSETKFQYAEIAFNAGDKLKAFTAYKEILQGLDGATYQDRIAPKFVDAFSVKKIIGGAGHQAFGSFSADGSKIVYQTDQNGNWDIYEFDMSTGESKAVVNSPAHEEGPAYSPDGKKLIYTSTEEDHREVPYAQKLRDIFMKDLENGRATNLTTNGSDDWHPSFSDNGQFIAFVSERSDLRDVPFYQLYSNIYTMEADGRFQLELAHADANSGSPVIAPGSTEEKGVIYFDSNRNGNKAIFRMDMKGENLRQITFNPNAEDAAPAISPSGDKIAFFSDRDGNYEIYMMNSDGSAQQRLTSNQADDLNPVFSPDGSNILFHSNRDGDFDIYLMDLTTQSSALPISDIISRIDQAINTLR